MFVSYSTTLPLSIATLEKRLEAVRSNASEMAGVAYREGEELRSEVGPWESGFAKEVELEIGNAEIHRTGIAFPIKWTATGAEVLFPKLEAELLLAHIGPNTTRFSLEGTYEPPMGVVGKVADRALLGRLAETAVRNWVDRLAGALVTDPESG